jgi:hypothetical protein
MMKTEPWGNAPAGQFQGLTASEFLPQLPQDEFLMGGWYADTPGKQMLDPAPPKSTF